MTSSRWPEDMPFVSAVCLLIKLLISSWWVRRYLWIQKRVSQRRYSTRTNLFFYRFLRLIAPKDPEIQAALKPLAPSGNWLKLVKILPPPSAPNSLSHSADQLIALLAKEALPIHTTYSNSDLVNLYLGGTTVTLLTESGSPEEVTLRKLDQRHWPRDWQAHPPQETPHNRDLLYKDFRQN